MPLINLTSEKELKELILKNKVGLMIHKHGCPFCEKAMPWMEELAESQKDRKIAIVLNDDLPNLLEVFNIKMYPTFLLIKEGKIEDMFYGDTQEEKVKNFISKDF